MKGLELSRLFYEQKGAQMLKEKFGVSEDGIQMQNISAAIGKEMRQDALISVAVATLCMLLYIWFRFRNLTFAAASVFFLRVEKKHCPCLVTTFTL